MITVKHFNIVEFGINDIRQGIAHVVTRAGLLAGMTVVCGDSHSNTWRIWLFGTVLARQKLSMC